MSVFNPDTRDGMFHTMLELFSHRGALIRLSAALPALQQQLDAASETRANVWIMRASGAAPPDAEGDPTPHPVRVFVDEQAATEWAKGQPPGSWLDPEPFRVESGLSDAARLEAEADSLRAQVAELRAVTARLLSETTPTPDIPSTPEAPDVAPKPPPAAQPRAH